MTKKTKAKTVSNEFAEKELKKWIKLLSEVKLKEITIDELGRTKPKLNWN